MKTCSKCKSLKAETEYGKDKLQKTGFRPDCRVCRKETVRKYSLRTREKRHEKWKLKYYANVDDNRKLASFRSRIYRNKIGKRNRFKWKSEVTVKNIRVRVAYKLRLAPWQKRITKSLLTPAQKKRRLLDMDNLRRKLNPESKRKWLESNRYRTQVYWQNRQKKQKETSDNTVTPMAILELLSEQKAVCVYCKENIEAKFEIDHKVPLARKGRHSMENIQLLCPPCNRHKYIKTHEEYLLTLS